MQIFTEGFNTRGLMWSNCVSKSSPWPWMQGRLSVRWGGRGAVVEVTRVAAVRLDGRDQGLETLQRQH